MSGPSNYTPKSSFAHWLERRLPILSFMHDSFVAYPTPKNLNYLWTFGAILSFMLVAQIVTGVVLAMHYTPETSLAFASVENIMRDVNWGWSLRYAHANGASMFFLAVYIHIFRGMYYGSYKEPREVLWILGVIIFLADDGDGIPWLCAALGTDVLLGRDRHHQSVLGHSRGRQRDHHLAARRLFGRQSDIEPLLRAALSAAVRHRRRCRACMSGRCMSSDRTIPTGVEVKDVEKETVRFTPYATMKDAVGIGVFLVLYAWLTFFVPNYLGHPDNYIEANPLVTPAHIVPEWYFLPFYAILRAIPNKLLGVIALVLGGDYRRRPCPGSTRRR